MGYGQPEHALALLKKINSFRQNNIGCDINVVDSNNTEHHVHQLILTAFSGYFEAVIGENQGKNQNQLLLPDIKTMILEKVLCFLYTGALDLEQGNFDGLKRAAIFLQIPTLLAFLEENGPQENNQQNDVNVNETMLKQTGKVERVLKQCNPTSTTKEHEEANEDDEVEFITTRSGRRARKPTHLINKVVSVERRRNRVSKKNTLSEVVSLPSPVSIREGDDSFDNKTAATESLKLEAGQPDVETAEVSDVSLSEEPKIKFKAKYKSPSMSYSMKTKSEIQDVGILTRNGPPPASQRKGKRKRKDRGTKTEEDLIDQEPKRKMISTLRTNAKEANSPEKSKTFECKYCDKVFVHWSSLKLHMLWHKPTVKKKHFTYKRKAKIKGYSVLSNKGALMEGWQCTWCKTVSNSRLLSRVHFLKFHSYITKCRFCRKHFPSCHDRLIHLGKGKRLCFEAAMKRNYTCSLCGSQFIHKVNVDKHAKVVHPGTSVEEILKPHNFKCQHCGSTFKYKEAFRSHLSHHGLAPTLIDMHLTSPQAVPYIGNVYPKVNTYLTTKTGPVNCSKCNRVFSSIHTLNQHMLQKHATRLYETPTRLAARMKWVCEEKDCEFTARISSQLKAHMESNHPGIMHMCPSCKYKTPVKELFNRHLKTRHDKTSDVAKPCSLCSEQFRTNYNLRVHEYYKHNVLHPSLKIHRCPVEDCDYFAFQRYIVDVHMSKHKSEKSFECHICGKKLKKEISIQRHIDKVHNRIRPFICEQCGSSYAEESELKTHVARHSKDKAFNCEHCGYSTSDKGAFNSHMWSQHKVQMNEKQRIFQCEHCPYSCDRQCRFDEHMTTHTGVRDYVCPDCGKSFLKKSTLRGHILWVHREKKVRCDFCDHVTSTMANLREHVRIMHTHRNLKPFKCSYCEFRCQTVGNCKKHINTKHKGMAPLVIKVCDKYPNDSKPLLKAEKQTNPHKNNTVAHFEHAVQSLIESKSMFAASDKDNESPETVPQQSSDVPRQESISLMVANAVIPDHNNTVSDAAQAVVPLHQSEPVSALGASDDIYNNFTSVSSFHNLGTLASASNNMPFDPSGVTETDQNFTMVMTENNDGKGSQQVSMLTPLLPSMYQIAQAPQESLRQPQQYFYLVPSSNDSSQDQV